MVVFRASGEAVVRPPISFHRFNVESVKLFTSVVGTGDRRNQ